MIEKAYITVRQSDEDGYPNKDPSGLDVEEYHRHQQLFFMDSYDMDGDSDFSEMVPYLYIPANSEAWSQWSAFPLRAPDVVAGDATDYFVEYYHILIMI